MDGTLVEEISKLQLRLARQVGRVVSMETDWSDELRSYSALRTGILEYSLIDVSARTLELRVSGILLDPINMVSSSFRLSAPGESWSTELFYENRLSGLS